MVIHLANQRFLLETLAFFKKFPIVLLHRSANPGPLEVYREYLSMLFCLKNLSKIF